MTGKRFSIAFTFLVFTGVAVHESKLMNPLSRSIQEYCADYLMRHPIACYPIDSWSGIGENHYKCKICRGLKSYRHVYDYDDYYDNIMSWERHLNSKLVEKLPTSDLSHPRKPVADVEEKSLSSEIVKVDASHGDKEIYENLYAKEAKDTNMNEISTKSEGSSPVTEEKFLEKNTKTIDRKENKETPGTIEPDALFTDNPISKMTEVRNEQKPVPVIGKSTTEDITKTERTTANSVFDSDEFVKDITIIKSTEGANTESGLAENSTYDIRDTITELLNDTKVGALDLKEVTDGKYGGTTQNTTAEENTTESTEPNNEIKNLTSVSEIKTTEVITVSRESNATMEEISETINTELDTTKPDDVNNYTRDYTIESLMTNVTVEDESVVFNLTEEISETINTDLDTTKPDDVNNYTRDYTIESLMTNVTVEDESVVFYLTTEVEEKSTAIYENSTTQKEAVRPQRTTMESEITRGGRLETKQTENTSKKEISTMAYSNKPGISGTASVETLSTMEISGVKTLRLVVSVLFLAIGLIATVILTIYMIKVKRRTIAYDQLKLLP